jgi:cytochrome c oxidase assembly protein subunit 15
MSGRASVTAWLSALFLLLLLLVGIGGFVRLSGSGLSLPGWPINNGSFLPPLSAAGWDQCYQLFQEDQQRLSAKVESGEAPGLGSLGHQPQDRGEFIAMYLIEWSHRFVAALVGLVALACCVVGWRHAEVRQRVGGRLVAIVGLIVGQALLGGLLVKSGTATHWLFLHLGLATIILAVIVDTILRLLAERPANPALLLERRGLRRWHRLALGLVFAQIVLGALVAGSRHNGFVAEWPTMRGELVPSLWSPLASWAWNLLDNFLLHQWLHRWFAWLVVALVVWLALLVHRRAPGARLKLASRVALLLLGVQVGLGLANVVLYAPLHIALGHLLTAMLLVADLMIIGHDLGHEPARVRCQTRPLGREGVQLCA